jgi:hypothetical protein
MFYICGFHTAVLYEIQELYTVQHNTLNVNTLYTYFIILAYYAE